MMTDAPPHRRLEKHPQKTTTMDLIKQAASLAKGAVNAGLDLVYNKSELEKKLDEALSKENWGVSKTLQKEIANATRDRCGFLSLLRRTLRLCTALQYSIQI